MKRILAEQRFAPAPHSVWRLVTAPSLAGAIETLQAKPCPVVLCERDLIQGDWRDLLRSTFGLPKPPAMIVTSRHADDYLWAEALNLGAYDVLMKPFDRCELTRVLGSACAWWGRQHGFLGFEPAFPQEHDPPSVPAVTR